MTYLLPDEEVDADELVGLLHWATDRHLPNPRVITPAILRWSSLFNPRFFDSIAAERGVRESRLVWTDPDSAPCRGDLSRLWLESILFLAGVTLSAAIVQSRYSEGTIASKYDRLWEAGVLATDGVVPVLAGLGLQDVVSGLATDTSLGGVERLIVLRRTFMAAYALLAQSDGATAEMSGAGLSGAQASRFGFVDDLRAMCGSDLRAIIVYGSSVSSANFADYDLLVVTSAPEDLLCQLAGKSPVWHGKEMNLGIYSPDQLLLMQRLSGDNLGDYGVCLWGGAPVLHKPVGRLLIRNFSFGTVRQRQQLGMLSRAVQEPISTEQDDRRNLHDYFVKIPANVAKGTFGALGERLPKEQVQSWMTKTIAFDAAAEQKRAAEGDPIRALARSALATGKVLEVLNQRVDLVKAV